MYICKYEPFSKRSFPFKLFTTYKLRLFRQIYFKSLSLSQSLVSLRNNTKGNNLLILTYCCFTKLINKVQMTSKIRIALTSTERFRTDHKDICGNFLKNNLLWLLANTDICITGKTFDFLLEVLQDLVKKNELKQDDITLYNGM
jgi:hypothetical protein